MCGADTGLGRPRVIGKGVGKGVGAGGSRVLVGFRVVEMGKGVGDGL